MVQHMIGECISLICSGLNIWEAKEPEYKKIFLLQFLRYAIQMAAYGLFCGWNGLIVTGMALIRNVFSYYKKFKGLTVAIWVVCSVILNLMLMENLIDLVPLAATIQYAVMIRHQTVLSSKRATLINALIWEIYEVQVSAWVYFIMNFMIALTAGRYLFCYRKRSSVS